MTHFNNFKKQFHEIIEKKLKKPLVPLNNLPDLKEKYKKKKDIDTLNKKTVVLSLDDCLVKTSIFKQDLPRVDGHFTYNNLSIYLCYRPHLFQFLR